MNETVKSNNIT